MCVSVMLLRLPGRQQLSLQPNAGATSGGGGAVPIIRILSIFCTTIWPNMNTTIRSFRTI